MKSFILENWMRYNKDVSSATVLKIINGKDGHISEETRQKVFEVIDNLRYVRNSMAKSLKEANTKTIVLIHSLISPAKKRAIIAITLRF